jgi:hypothetical protein
MAKTKISEFDTNPDLNTDINSINIAENCSPANINNAIRQLMSDLKDWQSGADDKYIAPAGTAAAPSWTFNGDTDTGFYSAGANQIGVAANGSSVGLFTSAGFVGNVTGNVTGNASTVTNGVYTTGDQTIAGVKTFSSSPVVPTAAVNDNSTNAASTAFVVAQIADDAPTKTGTGASGTWGIDISGNAATATTASSVSNGAITAAKLDGAQSGSAPIYGCRAWVVFDGTGSTGTNQTILASGNVSSVYKNGTGDYTVNFTTAIQDANYCVNATASLSSGDTVGASFNPIEGSIATGSVRLRVRATSTLIDRQVLSVAIFR